MYRMNTTIDSGEIASIVAIAGMVLSAIGVTGIDSDVLTGVVNGFVSIVAVGAAIWSWYSHRQKNVSLGATNNPYHS